MEYVMPRQRRGGATTLEDATRQDGSHGETTGAPGAAVEPPPAPQLPVLPAEKTAAGGQLEDKTVLVYGEAKIGKSTLASKWAGGDVLFFDCAGELADLSVYRLPCGDWTQFRLAAAAYAENMTGPSPSYKGCVIDTADVWSSMCAHFIRRKLGVVHESDAEWGKGWTLVKEEMQLRLARLQTLPGGVVLISHSKFVEIKRRRQEPYNKAVPTLAGGVREVIVNAADLVLFVDWAEDGENRVIYTKPDASFEAGERAENPHLPKEIAWPVGRSGWDVIKEAWDNG